MSSAHDAFRQAILAEPDEIAHRLAYSDWILENCPEDVKACQRAELIQLQVQIADSGWDHPPNHEMKAREEFLRSAVLIEDQKRTQKAGGVLRDAIYRAGFVEGARLSVDELDKHGAALFEHHPIRRITLGGVHTALDKFLSSPYLRQLRGLVLTNTSSVDSTLERFANEPALSGLEALEIRYRRITHESVQALAESSCIQNLRSLDLSNCSIDYEAIGLIATSPTFSKLEALNLFTTHLDEPVLLDLVKSPVLANLKKLNLGLNNVTPEVIARLVTPGNPVQPEWLNLGMALYERQSMRSILSSSLFTFTTEHAEAFQGSEKTGRLRWLNLSTCDLGLPALNVLAESPYLANLRALHLSNNPVFEAGGARHLLTASLSTSLHALGLARTGLSDRDAQILANSTNLRELRSLRLSNNSIRTPGARAFVTSPTLENLNFLELRGNRFSGKVAEELRFRYDDRVRL